MIVACKDSGSWSSSRTGKLSASSLPARSKALKWYLVLPCDSTNKSSASAKLPVRIYKGSHFIYRGIAKVSPTPRFPFSQRALCIRNCEKYTLISQFIIILLQVYYTFSRLLLSIWFIFYRDICARYAEFLPFHCRDAPNVRKMHLRGQFCSNFVLFYHYFLVGYSNEFGVAACILVLWYVSNTWSQLDSWLDSCGVVEEAIGTEDLGPVMEWRMASFKTWTDDPCAGNSQ